MTNRDAEITELWNAGVGLRDMEHRLGMSECVIRRRAKKIGLAPRRTPNTYTEEEKELILSMSAERKSLRAIGVALGRPHQSVTNWLKKLRGPVSPTSDARKSPTPSESPVNPPIPAGFTGSLASILRRTAQTNHLRTTAKIRTVDPGPPPANCSYPISERPFVFCGKPSVKHKPFCEEHTSRCYEKTKPIKIVPARAKEQPHYHDWGKW
jgi:hypothetical protein